ncbi:hypothetical protein [Priestia megaterium]|uniref:hypothetical protein n=1 Tax=Priestia megaterium TaxID=1404 RepID=UPI00064CB67D|nr:hypothetical protein [Priestia megaterium]KLV28615.1 hypothetical protein ABW04_28930 [Priestia megaterium]
MKISYIVSYLNDKGGTKALSKEIGIGEKRIRAALHAAGYSFKNTNKRWSFVGEGEEPHDSDIMSFLPKRPTTNKAIKRKQNKPTSITSHTNSHNDSPKREHKGEYTYELKAVSTFTDEEIEALKLMVHEFIEEKANQTPRGRLHDRTLRLNKETTTRKTIVIDKNVGKRFDEFAARVKLNKSDLLTLALINLMDAYEGD